MPPEFLSLMMSHCIVVSPRQETNPVLKFIRNIRFKIGQPFAGDYQIGDSACALFLSTKYHCLHPEYILGRIEEVKAARCRLAVLLLLVEDDDQDRLLEITHMATFHSLTLICAWSYKECARYLETLKAYEHKSPDSLKEQVDDDYRSRVTDILTSIKGVNTTDAATLLDRCGCLAGVFSGTEEQLSSCAGIGTTKVKELFETFHEPFLASSERRHIAKSNPEGGKKA